MAAASESRSSVIQYDSVAVGGEDVLSRSCRISLLLWKKKRDGIHAMVTFVTSQTGHKQTCHKIAARDSDTVRYVRQCNDDLISFSKTGNALVLYGHGRICSRSLQVHKDHVNRSIEISGSPFAAMPFLIATDLFTAIRVNSQLAVISSLFTSQSLDVLIPYLRCEHDDSEQDYISRAPFSDLFLLSSL